MKSRFYEDNQIKNGGVRSLYVNKRSDPKSNKNYICILIILRTIDDWWLMTIDWWRF